MLPKAESSNNRQLNALAQIGFSCICSVCVCPIGQLFRTNRNTRLDTSLVLTCLASPELSSPRVDFMCGLWQSCSLINDGCNAISIGFQWPQCNRARVRHREREAESERELALCCGCFQFVSVQTRTVTHSSQFIFHFPHNLSISTRRHIPAEAQ